MPATEDLSRDALSVADLHGFGGRILNRHAAHERLDPVTDDCLDCGATRREMDDCFAPTCEKAVGPHRAAVIALRREQRRQQSKINEAERNIEASRSQIIATTREMDALVQRRDELKASIAALEG